MDKPTLKNSLKLFEQLGSVRSRSMFGGFGIFIDEAMFALVVNESLYIRSCDDTKQQFIDLGYQPYVYKKRGFPVVTKYFALPESLWQESEQIIQLALVALKAAQQARCSATEEKPARLKDLPNLRLSTERMLKKAGIASVSELKRAGSIGAFQAIQQSHTSDLNIELLWALEGALKGTHWSVIPTERREQLIATLENRAQY